MYENDTTFEDHCPCCESVAVREAFYFEGLGEWVCEDCNHAVVWNVLDVLRLVLA